MKAGLKILAFLVGLALFAWYLAQTDLRSVGNAILRIGPLAPLILVPYFIVYCVDCLGWSMTLPRGHGIPFLSRLRIRWSGESVNNILPSAYIGGEAVKVYLLQQRGITPGQGTTSAVVSKTAQTVGQLLFVILGGAVFYSLAGTNERLRLALTVVVLGGCGAVGLLFWVQRLGLFRLFYGVSNAFRLRFQALENRREKILALDQAILGFYRHQPGRFYASTAFYFCGWLLDTLEIFFVAWLLGMPITWAQALVMEAFIGVAKVLGMWVPGSLGIQESGIVLLGRLAGLPDTLAAAYALIRRGRELIFVAAGMLLLYWSHDGMRALKTESEKTPLVKVS